MSCSECSLTDSFIHMTIDILESNSLILCVVMHFM